MYQQDGAKHGAERSFEAMADTGERASREFFYIVLRLASCQLQFYVN